MCLPRDARCSLASASASGAAAAAAAWPTSNPAGNSTFCCWCVGWCWLAGWLLVGISMEKAAWRLARLEQPTLNGKPNWNKNANQNRAADRSEITMHQPASQSASKNVSPASGMTDALCSRDFCSNLRIANQPALYGPAGGPTIKRLSHSGSLAQVAAINHGGQKGGGGGAKQLESALVWLARATKRRIQQVNRLTSPIGNQPMGSGRQIKGDRC